MNIINKLFFDKLHFFVKISFFVNIILMSFLIKPDRDDLNFISQSYGLINNNFPSERIYELNLTNYALLPFGHFVYGIYIKILYFFNPILINFYSLKIINIFFLLLTTYFVLKIFKNIKNEQFNNHFSLFLIFLSTSPFFIDILYLSRPEIFGIFFTTAAIFSYIKNKRIIASILLSFNLFVHPNFFIISFILTLLFIYKSIIKSDFKYFIIIFIYYLFFIFLYFIWFALNSDYSFNMFLNGIFYYGQKLNYLNSYKLIFKFIFFKNNLSPSANIYYSFTFTIFFIMIILSFINLIKDFLYKKINDNIVFILLFFSLIITLALNNTGKIQLYTAMSYFTCLCSISMLRIKKKITN